MGSDAGCTCSLGCLLTECLAVRCKGREGTKDPSNCSTWNVRLYDGSIILHLSTEIRKPKEKGLRLANPEFCFSCAVFERPSRHVRGKSLV